MPGDPQSGRASAPVGGMPVVCGPGWPGVLPHEAIGHGLEGDFNRPCLRSPAASASASRHGCYRARRRAAQGTVAGSLNVDDEGTPTHATVLIEDGIPAATCRTP